MSDFTGLPEPLLNAIFLIATAAVAWHGIRFRDDNGKAEFVHLLFGCIAAVFFVLVLFRDVFGLHVF